MTKDMKDQRCAYDNLNKQDISSKNVHLRQ